jgi:hypothetical protein
MQGDYFDSTPQVFTLQRQNDATFLAEVVASRVLFQAKFAVLVVVRDISERERLRQKAIRLKRHDCCKQIIKSHQDEAVCH